MAEKIIKKIKLKNGLTLEFIDMSRKVAGDRYKVVLKTRTTVPVKDCWFSEKEPAVPGFGEIVEKVGGAVVFEQNKERNFVDEREKDTVLNNLCDVSEDYGVRYIGHPEFPKKFILKRYNEKKVKIKI